MSEQLNSSVRAQALRSVAGAVPGHVQVPRQVQGQRPGPMQAWGGAKRSPRYRFRNTGKPQRGGPNQKRLRLGPPFQGFETRSDCSPGATPQACIGPARWAPFDLWIGGQP